MLTLTGKKGDELLNAVKYNTKESLDEAINSVSRAMEQLAELQGVDNRPSTDNVEYKKLSGIWNELEEINYTVQDYK